MVDQDGQSVTILDYKDKIQVPGRVFEKPNNEYWALEWLWEGLECLNGLVSKWDEAARSRLNPDGKLWVTMLGNCPEFDGIPKPLLTCAFHWYSITAFQYVKTVGEIASRSDPSRPKAEKYVQRVIPEILRFRNKVAAHFAWHTPHGSDSQADPLASIMPQLAFINDAFHVGAMSVRVTSGGKTSDASALLPWSIHDAHRQLRERYRPYLRPKA